MFNLIIKYIKLFKLIILFTFSLSGSCFCLMLTMPNQQTCRDTWKSSGLFTCTENYNSPKEHQLYHESGHALIAAALNQQINSLTIIPKVGNYAACLKVVNDTVLNKLTTYLGGYVAEEIKFAKKGENISSKGIEDDLDEATKIAFAIWIGQKTYNIKGSENLTPQKILAEHLEKARELISKNLNKLESIALALNEKQTLTGDEIYSIFKQVK